MNATQERNWAIACHLLGLVWIPLWAIAFVLPFVRSLIPIIELSNSFAPGIIAERKGRKSAFIKAHGQESFNFQISMLIYGYLFRAIVVVSISLLPQFGLAEDHPFTTFFVWTIVGSAVAIVIFQVIIVIFAAIKAKNGEMYRYPFNLRLFKKPSR